MDRKKIIFLIVIILVVIAGFLAVFLLLRKSEDEQAANSVSNSTPASRIGFEEAPQLPAGVEGVQTANGTTEAYKTALQEAEKKEGLYEFSLRNSEDKPIPLNNFLDSFNIRINDKVKNYLDGYNYRQFSCNDKDFKGLGIIFGLKPGNSSQYYADMYKDVGEGLKEWEKNAFSNLSKFFFTSSVIDQKTNFEFQESFYTTSNGVSSIKIRYANLKDSSGKEISVDYALFNEEIYVSNNKNCLRSILDKYADDPE